MFWRDFFWMCRMITAHFLGEFIGSLVPNQGYLLHLLTICDLYYTIIWDMESFQGTLNLKFTSKYIKTYPNCYDYPVKNQAKPTERKIILLESIVKFYECNFILFYVKQNTILFLVCKVRICLVFSMILFSE